MTESGSSSNQPPAIRWWPGGVIVVLAIVAVGWARAQADWPFQKRNLAVAQIGIIATILLLLWWTFISRAPKRLRLAITFGVVGLAIVGAVLFRLGGMTGDMSPILEYRWTKRALPVVQNADAGAISQIVPISASYPQFLGPDRNGVLPGPQLETNWSLHPPQLLWRQPIGAGWSGFAIVGDVALTQEQRGAEECVVAYDLTRGQPLWLHPVAVRYHTTIAGEGPRATPTIMGNHVFTFGATGRLSCLELATGKLVWSRDVVADSQAKVLQWGCASSPLIAGDLVIVHGGEDAPRSLFAYRIADGAPVWTGGSTDASYASPGLAVIADAPQVLAFNNGSVSGHDPSTGATLWERTWGNGNVVCASPLVVSSNRVLFSSGYGVGAELLEISRTETGKFSARLVWKSIRMKAKFSHLYVRDGFLYGLDDGILACVDLQDGSQRWKEGRYGHGQGLVVGEHYLLMSESGELVLLQPKPDAPNELARFRVFSAKTWNPIALAGDLLLVRNDREVACLRLRTVEVAP